VRHARSRREPAASVSSKAWLLGVVATLHEIMACTTLHCAWDNAQCEVCPASYRPGSCNITLRRADAHMAATRSTHAHARSRRERACRVREQQGVCAPYQRDSTRCIPSTTLHHLTRHPHHALCPPAAAARALAHAHSRVVSVEAASEQSIARRAHRSGSVSRLVPSCARCTRVTQRAAFTSTTLHLLVQHPQHALRPPVAQPKH
jgi:hypothetical protein